VVAIVTPECAGTGEPEVGHIPVLLTEAVDGLAVRPGGRYIDGTFGGGGHSRLILERSAPDGRVLAIDADPEAVRRADALLDEYRGRFTIDHSNFRRISEVARAHGFDEVEGVLFDLGLSSFQLDERDRGFSFHSETRLDMRFDSESAGESAWDIVNLRPQEEIADIIFQFGEERRSRRIASAIVRRRSESPIETNADLADVVERAVGGRRGARTHPATKTFQALRIAVNQELESLGTALEAARALLVPGGRLAVISFHSLEDRIVKQFFALEARDCVCPPHFPVCVCDHKSSLRLVTRRPIAPSQEEMERNPRSRSARLRIAERI
jgi:16S rRNA (cytosine1402-N4)-methyltransferase